MGEVKQEPEDKDSLTIAVTGANGFFGRVCVAEARSHGLPVLAMVRSAPCADWQDDPGITPVRLDLTSDEAAARLHAALPDRGALIHAAAHLGDDPARLTADTLEATKTVLRARQGKNIRLVLISSLAVYDTDLLSPGDSLTEASPLIPLPGTPAQARDGYAGSKRLQEVLLTHAEDTEDDWILRPGAIWGPGRSWHALMGFWASKLHVTIGSGGELPLTHVWHAARTAVEAARTPTEGVPVLNVFDDDRPTRARFLAAHRRCYGWPRLNVTVPYGLWLRLARLSAPVGHRRPGLLREPILRARMMPLRFPNHRLRSTLGGEDIDTFEGMMARTREAES